jgi:integrase
VFHHPERGTTYKAERFQEALEAVLAAAGVDAPNIRAFHDLRHSAITHDAASGASAIAVMAKAATAPWLRRASTYTWPASCSVRRPSG